MFVCTSGLYFILAGTPEQMHQTTNSFHHHFSLNVRGHTDLGQVNLPETPSCAGCVIAMITATNTGFAPGVGPLGAK